MNIYILALFIIIILLVFIILVIRRKLVIYEKEIINFNNTLNTINKEMAQLLEELRNVDIKGSFESDDEVGIVFNIIKNIIKATLNHVSID